MIDIEEDKQVPLLLGRPFLDTGAILIDVRKGELTLRVGNEEVPFNLNQSLKKPKFENAEYKNVGKVVPISYELIDDYKNKDSMNENMLNLQYIEDLATEHLDARVELKETILSLNENNIEKSSSSKEKVLELEKSDEGLIMKELPKHLKYAFLGAERSKLVIIETDETEDKKQKLL